MVRMTQCYHLTRHAMVKEMDKRQVKNHQLSEELEAKIEAGYSAAADLTMRATRATLIRISRILLILLAILAAIYVGDDLSLRFRFPSGRQPFSSMEVTRLYAIHKKSGKVEYTNAEPQIETCVNSPFPHFGYAPCWYLHRINGKRIDM